MTSDERLNELAHLLDVGRGDYDADLAAMLVAWPSLKPAIKTDIAAMVKAYFTYPDDSRSTCSECNTKITSESVWQVREGRDLCQWHKLQQATINRLDRQINVHLWVNIILIVVFLFVVFGSFNGGKLGVLADPGEDDGFVHARYYSWWGLSSTFYEMARLDDDEYDGYPVWHMRKTGDSYGLGSLSFSYPIPEQQRVWRRLHSEGGMWFPD